MTAPQWPGTPAEWDAERNRIVSHIREANIKHAMEVRRVRREDIHMDDSWLLALATATMPPRPVEPPSVVTASGWTVTCKNRLFYAIKSSVVGGEEYRAYEHAHYIAVRISATESEHDAIRALRDGPTARYEVCGYEHWRGNKYVQTFHVSDTITAESCKQSVQFEIIQTTGGGTAHAIYKRVGGA